MAKPHIDVLIDERLNGDKSRVLELFTSDRIFDELNRNSGDFDWLHFEPKNKDGDYLVKTEKDYITYMQERGRLMSKVEHFNSLKDAAASFFLIAGYI